MKLSDKSNPNFMIVRLSSMGDIVLTTPLPRLLKAKYPESNICYITDKKFTEIFKFNPHVDRVFAYDKNFGALDNTNKLPNITGNNKQFEFVIDLQHNTRSRILLRNIEAEVLRFNKSRLHKLSLVHLKRPMKENFSVAMEYIWTCRQLGIEYDGKGSEIWLENEVEYRSSHIKPENLKIAIAPGAYHFTKRWPVDKFIELMEIISMELSPEFILIGGKDDKEISSLIKEKATAKITDCSGSTSILETTGLLNQCSMLVTNDTGVMHIAAARKLPVLAIFGSTVKEFGFAPEFTSYEIAETYIDCRPCTHIGKSHCPRRHFKCMEDISPEFVFIKLKKLLVKTGLMSR